MWTDESMVISSTWDAVRTMLNRVSMLTALTGLSLMHKYLAQLLAYQRLAKKSPKRSVARILHPPTQSGITGLLAHGARNCMWRRSVSALFKGSPVLGSRMRVACPKHTIHLVNHTICTIFVAYSRIMELLTTIWLWMVDFSLWVAGMIALIQGWDDGASDGIHIAGISLVPIEEWVLAVSHAVIAIRMIVAGWRIFRWYAKLPDVGGQTVVRTLFLVCSIAVSCTARFIFFLMRDTFVPSGLLGSMCSVMYPWVYYFCVETMPTLVLCGLHASPRLG